MQIRFLASSADSGSLLRRLAAFGVTALLVLSALTFSLLLLAIVLVAGTMAWGYLWWQTRALRKQLRGAAPRAARTRAQDAAQDGMVIEGEATRVDVA